MSLFKSKATKLKFVSNVRTVDEIHRNYLAKIEEKQKELPSKKRRLNNLISEAERCNDLKQKTRLRKEIKELKEDINKMVNNSEILEYISKTGDLLVDYYKITSGDSYNVDENNNVITECEIRDLSEVYTASKNTETEQTINEEHISGGIVISDTLKMLHQNSQKHRKVKKPIKQRRPFVKNNPGKSILHFFSSENGENLEKTQNHTDDINSIEIDKENLNVVNRATIQDKYLRLIDKNYACEKVKIEKINYCSICKTEKSLSQSDGSYVCTSCGEVEFIIMESEIPNHKELANEKQKYPYKKINHLKEKLNQFQSKESADVPDDICLIIKTDLRKNRVQPCDCTPPAIKKILKKHKLTSYYEHLQQIYCKISGSIPITLSRETEEVIINMFQSMQDSFHKYCPPNRSNFLSYSYVLNKLFRILNMKEHAKYFGLLKSKDKLRDQDIIWSKICKDMDWKFHSSF